MDSLDKLADSMYEVAFAIDRFSDVLAGLIPDDEADEPAKSDEATE